ncbi:bifunctional alpha,alpha-trehalose-phosphate synthase (UDP-forming)/trehalose-phosphatase [Bacteroidota bacterium]
MDGIIIVSNRLPISIKKSDGKYNVIQSAGGLATGLKSYHQNNNSLWIGWPSIEAENLEEEKIISKLLAKDHCLPVFLTKELIELYYDGFCNATIWPLFHYFTDYTQFRKTYWNAYEQVNFLFAEAILATAKQNDMVWIHDYQLMLVPDLVKSKRPDLSIGFFLHIPFPSYEVFRILPYREKIIQGLLGADLIGFHTYDYARHFISSVKRLMGYDVEFNTINLQNRQLFVDVFPMGIDFDKFHETALKIQSKSIQEHSKQHQDIDRFLHGMPDRKIILSIDRLDYTKGIPERLNAFSHFLTTHPEYREKVSLLMLTVPSRTAVKQYQELKSEVEELVGKINGKYGTLNWNPVIYFYRSLPFSNLIELYSSADIALLTPLRDGMNLVAKEFIASKVNPKGVLILSEMAGATKELGEALAVNPNDVEDVSNAIYNALTMSDHDQSVSIYAMQKRIRRYNVFKWADEFVESLEKTKKIQTEKHARKVSESLKQDIYSKFWKAKQRILFLDYDGTLQRFFGNPEDAKPDRELIQLINGLIIDNKTELVIISGRDKNTLEDWFGSMDIALIAEHGAWIKVKNDNWKERNQRQSTWKDSIRPVLESYVDRTPGSLIEEKSHSLVWHYRKTDVDLGVLRALELTTDLSGLLMNQDLEIMEGSKVIEVKVAGINKGKAALDYIHDKDYNFIMAIGDDWTDEYLFKELPEESFTIKVGSSTSAAKFYIDNYKEVRSLLMGIIEEVKERNK